VSVSPSTWLSSIQRDRSVSLPKGAIKVAQALADFAIERNIPASCPLYPGRDRLCEQTGLSPRSVLRNIAILIEHGLIERLTYGVSKGRDGKPHRARYRLVTTQATIQGVRALKGDSDTLTVLNPHVAELADQASASQRSPVRGEALKSSGPRKITQLPPPLVLPTPAELRADHERAREALDSLWYAHEFKPWTPQVSAEMERRRRALLNTINRMSALDALRASEPATRKARA
jgi:hypothetical protein